MELFGIFAPFVAFVIVGVYGRKIGVKGSAVVVIVGMLYSLVVSMILLYKVCILQNIYEIEVGTWFSEGLVMVKWSFYYDSVSAVMFFVVTFISFLVHVYSVGYMDGDPHVSRFLSYLSLFTFFMLILVTAGNLVQMFLGWEGVGLVSYLLISFWYTRVEANRAALKAIIVNRVGDFAFLMAILVAFNLFRGFDFALIFALVPSVSGRVIEFMGFQVDGIFLLGIFLVIAAVGKSAQLGLHTWLPDAMEAPTPVSALLHAATMVTAGIFVLVRCSMILEYSGSLLTVVMVLGALTAFFAGIVALVQNDIKKVIAYSTCSQLGYMFMACGMSSYGLAMFHLVTHAFFKALLFLGAGAVIHALGGEQDLRRMGGLVRLMPLTYILFFIGSFSLMGFPFMAGFYSKDAILEVLACYYSSGGAFAYSLATISVFFTAFYSTRVLILAFISKPMTSYKVLLGVHEPGLFMLIPLLLLGVFSIFAGYFLKDLFIGLGSTFWNGSIYVLPEHNKLVEAEFLPLYLKLLPLFFTFLGISLAFLIYLKYPILLDKVREITFLRGFYRFLSEKWYFDQVYNYFIVRKVLYLGYDVGHKIVDNGIIDLFGSSGLVRFISYFTVRARLLQSGLLYHYLFFMCTSVVLFAIFLFWFDTVESLYIIVVYLLSGIYVLKR